MKIVILLATFVLFSCHQVAIDSHEKVAKPNIIVILADDMGYSDVGCYGSEIPTPNIDRLAREGVKFTQFYNASVCCPTRASLMTGLYQHEAGVGYMDSDLGYESYQGHIKHNLYTIPEALSQAGYSTIMAGKWHLGTGEGDNPWERGFGHFYGIPKGGGVYFWPPHLDRDVVTFDESNGLGPVIIQPDSSIFYSTDAFTDFVVGEISNHKTSNKPFFIYTAYIAPHWPQQAWEKDIQKYLGKYKKGWGKLREERYQRQIDLGIVDPGYPLTPGDGLKWDKLSESQKEKFDRQMAVYAAQVDNLDFNIGRILDALEYNELVDNTMVIFLSDNGAQNNPLQGFERMDGAVFGTKESLGGYAKGWGNLSNTPYRRYKLEEFQGGNLTPFIVRWPSILRNRNETSSQVGHIIDIFPTCLAVAGIEIPDGNNSGKGQVLEGLDLLPYARNTTLHEDRELYWEHKGNRAVRKGDWKLVASYKKDWELYNLTDDATEMNDVSSILPEKVSQLKDDYDIWAKRTGVLPWPVKN